MKHFLIILIIFSAAARSEAQIFNEWFRQKQTQKKYLIQQIAALQVYSGYVEKGYGIVRNGLNTISSIKKGDLNLHTDYFNSLKKINPAVGTYGRVADIIRLQLEIVLLHKKAINQIRQSSQFIADETGYVEKVYSTLLGQTADIMDELIQVTTAGKLEMKDNERLKRIDSLYAEMQDLQGFAQAFFSQAQVLSIQRQKEQHDIQTSRLINGVK